MSEPSQAPHPGEALSPSHSPAPVRQLKHIRELDGVRGIAALMVFFHHLTWLPRPDLWPLPVRLVEYAAIAGRYGVDLFFVLSGFLITSLLLEARSQPFYYHDFYWKRALRILPPYLLCLLGVYLFIPGSGKYVLASLFFVVNFVRTMHMSGPFWTLAIEEQFYLLWPTVVHRRSVAQLRRWALAVGGSAVLLRLAAAAIAHYDYEITFLRCDGLACGAFLACWFFGKTAEERATPALRRTLGWILLVSILLLACAFLPPGTTRRLAFEAAAVQTGVTLMAAAVVAWLIAHSGRPSLAIFRSSVLTFFGLISYVLYLIHLYVMRWYDQTHPAVPVGDWVAYVLRMTIVLAVTILVCLISRYAVELPTISLRRFVLVKPAPPNPHPTPQDPPIPLGNL